MTKKSLFLLLACLAMFGCSSKAVPPDTAGVKYVNRSNPGSLLKFDGSLFVPGKINVLYFYADW